MNSLSLLIVFKNPKLSIFLHESLVLHGGGRGRGRSRTRNITPIMLSRVYLRFVCQSVGCYYKAPVLIVVSAMAILQRIVMEALRSPLDSSTRNYKHSSCL